MKKLFNDGFSFLLMKTGSTYDEFMACAQKTVPVSIPHDWVIDDAHNFYTDGCGCYIKNFEYEMHDKARVFLRFDGVYMDSRIYLNDTLVGEWKYGYTSFVLDITEHLKTGENTLVAIIDYRCPNSRWYSGAGIYRNVWLIENENIFIPDNGIYVHSYPEDNKLDGNWIINYRN